MMASLSVIGCQTEEPADPLRSERVVSINREALGRFLEHTARLTGTPAARHSQQLLDRTASCDELWARIDAAKNESEPSTEVDFPALACRKNTTASNALSEIVRERRGDADGFLSWPIGEDGRIELRFRIDPRGGLEIDGELVSPSDPGAFSLFVPGHEPPAAPVVTPSATLVHLRMRPAEGIGLSNLIPSGSQADRLFALKGRLLEGALLTGTWEFAFMPPASGGEMPLAIAALHHRLASAIDEALNEALTQLETTWPIQRSPRLFTLPGGSTLPGACFLDLPLLPELAPCWVVTPDALLVGYRGEAIDAALASPAVASPGGSAESEASALKPGPNTAGRLDIHLDRLARVDESLLGPNDTPPIGQFFSKFELRMGAEADGRIMIHARLRRSS